MVIYFFFTLSVLNTDAQSDYQIFKDSATFQRNDTGKLSVELDNLNYLRNYEYFGKIPLSYTLFGYQLIPQLKYQFNQFFSLKGGAFVRREFGLKDFVNITPMFTAKYQKNGFSFLLGSLEGSLNHRFIEPIYNLERFINDRIEQGAQAILDKKSLWADWYIDWEKAIKRYSPYREEFTTGVSSRIKLFDIKNVNVEIPIQAITAHKGGQIDSSGLPVETLLNTAAGVSLNFRTISEFLPAIRTEHYFVYYKDLSEINLQLYKEGMGFLSSVTFKTKYIDVDLRHWWGDKFFGPRGTPLYSSISEQSRNFGEEKRHLLFLNLIYDRQLFKNIFIHLRFEPYYDFRNEMVEYAYSVFLRFRKDFLIAKLK
ncbi:MAG: hypothetical protein ICV66_01580 [Chitinophagaceae bacterium]|nr:hypothetical protein [Chitinophagaceae bacterium]